MSQEGRPRPLGSMVASAARIKSTQIVKSAQAAKSWQEDAWDMYDLVGEQRFLASTLANRVAQARLYVGKVPQNPMDDPEPVEDTENLAFQAFSYFGDTPQQRAQLVQRLAVNLFVSGDGWLVGIPKRLMEQTLEDDRGLRVYNGSGLASDEDEGITDLDDLQWRMLSVSEVKNVGERVQLHLGLASQQVLEVEPKDVWMIRVWRPHPRKWWEADSPTRSSLPVLRELVGLTMHISAQVDSRLAGAGLLIVPQSAQTAIKRAMGINPDGDADSESSDIDPFTEALMEAMITPISDRSNASALVPLVVTVPDDATGLFQYMTFAKPLDTEARNLRDEAIRRLALGQDAPPELLLGTAGMNHWGAWLVREDVVQTHIEPPLSLICDALTTQYLWPVLIEQGATPEEAQEYVVWYDVGQMIQRPNRLQDAALLFDKGVISDDALREAGGFNDADGPTTLDKPIELAIELAMKNPALVDNMKEIIAAFKEVLSPAVVGDLPEGEDALDQVDEATSDSDGSDDAQDEPGGRAASTGPGTPPDAMTMPEEMR